MSDHRYVNQGEVGNSGMETHGINGLDVITYRTQKGTRYGHRQQKLIGFQSSHLIAPTTIGQEWELSTMTYRLAHRQHLTRAYDVAVLNWELLCSPHWNRNCR